MTLSPSAVRRLTDAAQAEAHRARDLLRSPGFKPPYLVSYLIRDVDRWRIEARFGALFAYEHAQHRTCFSDVRVGSYRYDHVQDGGLHDSSTKAESYGYSALPIGGSVDGFVHGLWQLTECRYREAIAAMLDKRAEALHYRDPNKGLTAFEARDPVIARTVRSFPEFDGDAWAKYVERASAEGRKHPDVHACHVSLRADLVTKIYVSTEGSVVIERSPYFALGVDLELGGESGFYVPWRLSAFVTDPSELPPLKVLRSRIRRTVAFLRNLGDAPTLRSYAGPVILDPQPAGLLIHEALGHRLEGSRLLSPGEGQTLKDAVGEEILPSFLTLRDDPTQKRFAGQSLVGHYEYDDEGVEAAPVMLVERGRVSDFLTTRSPLKKGHRSNGHARNHSFERPMSRMGVTVLEAENGLDDAAMKKMLLEEVAARELPYGIRVLYADGGETTTKSYDFQAFLGEIKAATRIFPDGREELIRGVNFVGTPLNAMRNIRAAGNAPFLENAFCGAESGWVPVSTVSPSLLVSGLELQSTGQSAVSPFTYPMPWAE